MCVKYSDKTIQAVADAMMCCNCGACAAACPADAIAFKQSVMGRMYAQVDEDKCIGCSLCTKVCPSIDLAGIHKTHEDRFIGHIEKAFVGKCTDEACFANAQNGGTCTATLNYLFEQGLIDGAIVCRADYGATPETRAVVITDPADLRQSQKSCYTPVELLTALKQTSQLQSVAVVGLPCHIQGVELLMRNHKFKNINYRLGLVCDRTLCGGIREVMHSFAPEMQSKQTKIVWRKKDFKYAKHYYPYATAPVVIEAADGDQRVLPNAYRFALKDFFTAPRCRVCYDKLNTFADIVFGDPWGISGTDERHGESLVLTRTAKGSQVVDEMIAKHLVTLREVPATTAAAGQHIAARKQQVGLYSQAIHALPRGIDTYLYHQPLEKQCTQQEQTTCEGVVLKFLQREQLSQDQLIAEARTLAIAFHKRKKQQESLVYRILHRIKSLVK